MVLLTGEIKTWQIVVGVVAVIAVATVYVLIHDHKNTKLANTGEDKNRLKEILRGVVPDLENYTTAYASWQITKYYGRRSETTYWYYGIAFNDDRIHVVQLENTTGQIRGANSFVVEKSRLGMVNSKPGLNWMSLYDEDGDEIVSLMVVKENLKDDSFHPVNIIQGEEAEAFQALVTKWLEDVNTAKGVTVTGKYGIPLKKK